MPIKLNSSQSTDSSYSSSAEINTGAKWISGKDIWKKTIAATGPIPTGSTNFPHSITDLDSFVKIEGFYYLSSGSSLPPVWWTGSTDFVTTNLTATNVSMSVGAARANINGFAFTLYYTKV